MGPGHLYYLGILLTGLFIAPFSPLARVIVASWLLGEYAFWLGIPANWVNLAQHLAAFIVGSRYLRNEWCLLAWVMFLPMLACDALALIQEFEVLAWWGLLCTALAQLVFLPLGMDFSRARTTLDEGWQGYAGYRREDFLRVGIAVG
ncbi:hypothetical protein ABS767_17225 [Sphingomonas sp. ST-64]|uniref:Uncharacterized protein n=1 Tax=Sphingomonas plantiphila TaxID=3163295 RepID=A0ABW8YU70_9SPHN